MTKTNDKISIPATATKARRAARRLRHFGIIAYFDAAEKRLTAYVLDQGETVTRNAMLRALDEEVK
jgi:hypothetical protein